MAPRPEPPIAIGIDLGSSRIKAAPVNQRGDLGRVVATRAPALTGSDPRRTGDAEAYLRVAEEVLSRVAERAPGSTPLGLASQRSTFVIWDRADGRAVRPMVSWQDRTAAGWCDAHRNLEPEIVQATGLLLSPHYLGPKLAAVLQSDSEAQRRLSDGSWKCGTLDSFAVWRWSRDRCHRTDPTIAARTLMFDLTKRRWSRRLIDAFGVPASALPTVTPTLTGPVGLDSGLVLTASMADQAAAALAMLPGAAADDGGDALVNLGTGAFVLVPTGDPTLRRPGYLLGPILGGPTTWRFCLEGTVNGAGPALESCRGTPAPLPEKDPSRDAFAIPDMAGLGCPHWRPDIGLRRSPAAERQAPDAFRRTVVEGLLFRVAEILEGILDRPARRIVVAGGVSADPAVVPGLAALLGRTVDRCLEADAGLRAVGRLAGGLDPAGGLATHSISAGAPGAYLVGKYPRWRQWMSEHYL